MTDSNNNIHIRELVARKPKNICISEAEENSMTTNSLTLKFVDLARVLIQSDDVIEEAMVDTGEQIRFVS